MKNLPQHLIQAFNALEFANAGHLTALTALLNQQDRSVPAARPGHRNIEPEQDSGSSAS